MSTPARFLTAIAILLLIVAVRTMFVGYASYTPLVFAELYIGVFAIAMMFPSFMRTSNSEAGDHLLLVFVAAAIGAQLLTLVAPQIGEPSYCGGRYLLYSISRVPTLYRCTTVPFGVAGWFAGWWIAIWTVEWWSRRLPIESELDAAGVSSQPSGRGLVILALVVVIVSVYRLFAGSASFKPLALAEIGLLLFALFMAVPSILRAEQSSVDPDRFVLYSAALVGAVLFWSIAPQIGEPNYCLPLPRGLRVLRDLGYEVSRSVGVIPPAIIFPKVFRCTAAPFAVAGAFAGWWMALWASERWKRAR
jgi:hypothetical protein